MRAVLAVLLLSVLGVGCGSSGARSTTKLTHVLVFKVPSSSMEPTLHCKRGPQNPGCLGPGDDRVLVQPGKAVKRGDILVVRTPQEAAVKCGERGIFIKRLIGLPGETVHEDAHGFIDIDGKRLSEPYLSASRRLADSFNFNQTWHVPKGTYFVLGDNRSQSCDSRVWGGEPARDVLGPVVKVVHAR
jgi:signal peptidase I